MLPVPEWTLKLLTVVKISSKESDESKLFESWKLVIAKEDNLSILEVCLKWGYFRDCDSGPNMVMYWSKGNKRTSSHPFVFCFLHVAFPSASDPVSFRTIVVDCWGDSPLFLFFSSFSFIVSLYSAKARYFSFGI